MATVVSQASGASLATPTRTRAHGLAERLEQGARALEAVAASLTEQQWQLRLPKDGRKIGVVVHHVATMYPLEIQLALTLATGTPITGVTAEVVNTINAEHAKDYDGVTKQQAIDLLRRNSADAAAAIRALTDA